MGEADLGELIPTASHMRTAQRARAELWVQRAGVMVLAALVALACFGVLGPQTDTHSSKGEHGTLTMEYSSTSRPGLDTEVTVTFTPARTHDSYLLRLDQAAIRELGIEQIHPEPIKQWSRGSSLLLEFAASGTEPFDVVFNGRVPVQQPPTITQWQAAWLAGGRAVEVDATTVVLP